MQHTTDPISAPKHGARITPEFVPIPNTGGDAVTGLSRSYWYGLESQGLIKLVRIRRPGTIKARVLLPVAEAVALIRRLSGYETTTAGMEVRG